MLIRHILRNQMRTRYKGEFQKIAESWDHHSSNGVYYARFESGGKEIRRSLRTTPSIGAARARLAESDSKTAKTAGGLKLADNSA